MDVEEIILYYPTALELKQGRLSEAAIKYKISESFIDEVLVGKYDDFFERFYMNMFSAYPSMSESRLDRILTPYEE